MLDKLIGKKIKRLITVENKILKLFEDSGEWTPKEITFRLGVSKQIIHRVLARLLESEIIEKYGKPPRVVYKKRDKPEIKLPDTKLSEEDTIFLRENFLLISETGDYLEGAKGFQKWCITRKLPIEKTVLEFIKTKKKYKKYNNSQGYINGTEKLKNTKGFTDIYVDELYYLDFYAIERFGKTKLGTLLHYAKQGQNEFLMRKLMELIKHKIEDFIKLQQAEIVGFVPPTIRREIQIMDFIENSLEINKPLLDLQKLRGLIPVPQKSLNKLEERINNADSTFAIFGNTEFETLVLIDDAVGSGATINQIAKKIKNKNIARRIIGLAIVGSYKGFDVITDV